MAVRNDRRREEILKATYALVHYSFANCNENMVVIFMVLLWMNP